MTYANDHPVRLAGGRLALNLLNTADWSAGGAVVHEKIETLADLNVWLEAVGLSEAAPPESVEAFYAFRGELRRVMLAGPSEGLDGLIAEAAKLAPGEALRHQPLLPLAAASAVSILADPREYGRIKACPGKDCGWLFIDETRNGRRKWCLMETCGNRAKAARHYEKTKPHVETAG